VAYALSDEMKIIDHGRL